MDRLVNSLKQKLEISEKMAASVDAVRERKRAAAEEAAQLQPKLKLIVEKTRELQTQVGGLPGIGSVSCQRARYGESRSRGH